jgi:hypothetical protein
MSGRLQEQLDEAPLFLGRQADYSSISNYAERDLLGGGNHKLADGAPLKFRGVFQNAESVGGNANCDAGRAFCSVGHTQFLVTIDSTGFHRTM